MLTKSAIATQNLDLIQQAIDDANRQMTGLPLSPNDFRIIRGDCDTKLENLRAESVWVAESFRRLIATIEALELKIDQQRSEISEKTRIIYQIKKTLGDL